jgi:hypothetical protein
MQLTVNSCSGFTRRNAGAAPHGRDYHHAGLDLFDHVFDHEEDDRVRDSTGSASARNFLTARRYLDRAGPTGVERVAGSDPRRTTWNTTRLGDRISADVAVAFLKRSVVE